MTNKSDKEKKKEANKQNTKKNGWGEVIRTFAWALLIAAIFRTFLFQPFHIPSGSMKPNLLVGDFVIASQTAYGYSKHSFPFVSLPLFDGRIWYTEPERGDVVIFKVPSKSFGENVMIKRLVGLPGDKIQMINSVLHINGKPVEIADDGTFRDGIRDLKQQEETLPNGVKHKVLDSEGYFPTDETEVYEVPEGHFFMMGDNRDNSNDSRFAIPGFVPAENLIARAEFVMLSSDGMIINPTAWRFDRFFKSLRN
jgi:signal peptidase I